MSWIALGAPINDGINLFWRLPVAAQAGALWVRLPGFDSSVKTLFIGVGDERVNSQPDFIDSTIEAANGFGRIYKFEIPRLTSPVLGLRLEGGALPENPMIQMVQSGGSTVSTGAGSSAISVGAVEPASRPLWWETDAQGIPLYSFAWRWNVAVQRWVSDQAFTVSFLGSGSGFKSGAANSRFRIQPGNLFIEKLDYRFYLNTGVAAANWSLELKEVGVGLADPTWRSVTLSGSPLQQWRFTSLPINEIRAAPLGGWTWKLSPVQLGGSVEFDVMMTVRELRPT